MKRRFFNDRYLLAAIIGIAAFLAINMMTLGSYGETVDENFSFTRGRETLKYISQVIETGNFKFAEMNTQVLSHPTFFAIVNYKFAALMRDYLGLNHVDAFHVLTVIAYAICLFFVFLFARKMFGSRAGLYSFVFLMFFPILIAHSHYNPKDVPAMAFMALSLYYAYLFVKKERISYSVLAGIFAAMSIASKLDGLFIIPIFLLSYAAYFLLNRRKEAIPVKKHMKLSAVFLLSAGFMTYVFWPQLWSNPFFIFKSIGHFTSEYTTIYTLYFGKTYLAQNVPWHYVPFTLFLITPIITFVFFLIGLWVSIKSLIKDKDNFRYLLLISWFFVPFIARCIGKLKYDEDRQLLSIIPALAILSGLGLDYFLSRYFRRLSVVALAVIAAILFKEIAIIHPFEGGYANEAVRLFVPSHIERKFNLEYWGSAYGQGIGWLNANAEPDSQICIQNGDWLAWNYHKRGDLVFACDGREKYILTRPRYDSGDKYPVAFKISIYGDTDLLYIYKIK